VVWSTISAQALESKRTLQVLRCRPERSHISGFFRRLDCSFHRREAGELDETIMGAGPKLAVTVPFEWSLQFGKLQAAMIEASEFRPGRWPTATERPMPCARRPETLCRAPLAGPSHQRQPWYRRRAKAREKAPLGQAMVAREAMLDSIRSSSAPSPVTKSQSTVNGINGTPLCLAIFHRVRAYAKKSH